MGLGDQQGGLLASDVVTQATAIRASLLAHGAALAHGIAVLLAASLAFRLVTASEGDQLTDVLAGLAALAVLLFGFARQALGGVDICLHCSLQLVDVTLHIAANRIGTQFLERPPHLFGLTGLPACQLLSRFVCDLDASIT